MGVMLEAGRGGMCCGGWGRAERQLAKHLNFVLLNEDPVLTEHTRCGKHTVDRPSLLLCLNINSLACDCMASSV